MPESPPRQLHQIVPKVESFTSLFEKYFELNSYFKFQIFPDFCLTKKRKTCYFKKVHTIHTKMYNSIDFYFLSKLMQPFALLFSRAATL